MVDTLVRVTDNQTRVVVAGADLVQPAVSMIVNQTIALQAAAATSASLAMAAAEATGFSKFYDNKAAATADLASITAGQIVEVNFDESRGGQRTRYRKEGSALVFKIAFPDYLKPTAEVGRSYMTAEVPYLGSSTFIDNALSIRNNSIGTLGRGNAAINFLDSAGTERGAVGYSRNSALLPDVGYGPNTLYIEIGNPFTTDAQATDFGVIVSLKAGGPYWGGLATAYKAFSISSQNGSIEMTTNGGTGAISIRDDTYFGRDGGPRSVAFNMASSRMRIRERGAANQIALGVNIANMAAPLGDTIARDNNALSAWSLSFGPGSDNFAISRAGVGVNTQSDLLRLDSNGTLSLFSSDDSAVPLPLIVLDRKSASPATDDKLAEFRMQGRSSTGVTRVYSAFRSDIVDPTNAAEIGAFVLRTINAGAEADVFQFRNGRIRWGASGDILDLRASGSPEGVITAPVGSTYRRVNGGAGTTLYVKETGTGNTGWIAK